MIPLKHPQSDSRRTYLKAVVLSLVLIHFVWIPAKAAGIQLNALNNRWNYFSGQDHFAKYRLSANSFFRGEVLWRLVFQGRTLQRGEKSITIQAAYIIIDIDLRLPETKNDVVMPVDLELRVKPHLSEQPLLQTTEKKWVFSRHLFAERKEELKHLNI